MPRSFHLTAYLTSEIRPVMERQPGHLGMSLLLARRRVPWVRIVLGVERCAPGQRAVIAASVREAARQAGGTVTRERYAVLVFE
jgi:hypothetical protein